MEQVKLYISVTLRMNILIKSHENNFTEMNIFCLKAIISAKILLKQIQKNYQLLRWICQFAPDFVSVYLPFF